MLACLIIISSQEEYNSFICNSFPSLRLSEVPLVVGIRKGVDFPHLKESEVFILQSFSSLAEVNRATLYPELLEYNSVLTMDPDEIYSVNLRGSN